MVNRGFCLSLTVAAAFAWPAAASDPRRSVDLAPAETRMADAVGAPPAVPPSAVHWRPAQINPPILESVAPLLELVPSAMTLEDLERMALECNPTLVQSCMAVRSAEGDCIQAGLYPNPKVGYVADEIGNDGAAGMMGGAIGQQFVTGGKLRLSRSVAGHEIERARFAWEAQRWRVLNDVRRGYYEVLLAQKRIEVNQQLMGIEDQILKSTQQLRGAKEVSEVDVLQARVEAESATLKLSEARDRHQSTWRRLSAAVGRPDMEPAALAGDVSQDLPALTWEDSLAALLRDSPELARARAGVDRARCELARQCAERVPNLDVGTALKYDTASRYTIVDVEVALPLQIFNRNQGNIVKAQAALASAEHEVRRVELDLRERLATAFEQYVSARRRVEAYSRSILPHARKSLELTSAGYREGEFTFLTLLTAQRTFFDKTLEHLASLEELWGRNVELEGLLLQGALQSPVENAIRP